MSVITLELVLSLLESHKPHNMGDHDDFRGDTVVVHTTARMIEITHFARSNIQYGLYYSM
jgi:hypothetical protein